MAHDTMVERPPGAGGWEVGPAHDALQLIAEGVTEVVGFQVATISIVRNDHLETVAAAGSPEVRRQLLGMTTPMGLVRGELAKADDWGLFKFVPAERAGDDAESFGWIPDIEVPDDPAEWHPLDLLMAPLYDEHGGIGGLLSLDLPVDGRRPDTSKRRLLETYAAQAARAVLIAIEREALAETVRLARAARAIVRRASAQLTLDDLFAQCSDALVEGFRAAGMWIQVFDEEGTSAGAVRAAEGPVIELPPDIVAVAREAAQRAWHRQEVGRVTLGEAVGNDLEGAVRARVDEFLDSIGVHAMLFVPLGAGPTCLGNLVLTRVTDQPPWSEAESAAALDIGHDLGGAVLNARTFEREHRLVEELRELDTYKSELIATVSHELKNPLTALTAHLGLLAETSELSPSSQASVVSMDRSARRLARIVDDLLTLSRVGDPRRPISSLPVDLGSVVQEVVDLHAETVARRRLRLRFDAPASPVVALGDPAELDRLVGNLVSNAVKYSCDGGSVSVRLRRRGDRAVLECADEGLGISQADQRRLFTEFFRSTNPLALDRPGTGLGLAIVARIVHRHGGRIDVESRLARGSTFRVFLPAAG